MAINDGGGGAPASSVEVEARDDELLENLTFQAFGDGFEPAYNVRNTRERIDDAITSERQNTFPASIQEYQCRIGLSTFFVPPLNINVNQRFGAGSMVGASIRQQNSPKFSTGHSQTTVDMTLYFPTVEEIWGVEQSKTGSSRNLLEIDFDSLGTSDKRIDRMLSSLRGLIAQFKYSPFLPIRNAYLNRVYDITGVALHSMTVATVPNFPNCMAVNLSLWKFNHKVYLPMIEDFNNAFHYGRLRQYLGRAMERLNRNTKPFKVFDPNSDQLGEQPEGTEITRTSRRAADVLVEANQIETDPLQRFVRPTVESVSKLQFYYPFHTPAKVDLPELEGLRPGDDIDLEPRARVWWERILSSIGIDTDVYDQAHFAKMKAINESMDESYYSNLDEFRLLYEYLQTQNQLITDMGPDALEAYIAEKIAEYPGVPTENVKLEIRTSVEQAWFAAMFRYTAESPAIAAKLANDDRRRRQLTIDEWDVPMWELNLDPNYFTVEGISLSLGNRFSNLQLQMQDEPTYQHIGGEDTRVDISLTFHGDKAEEQILKLRNMFDAINGLARLEHNHGVLGFIGIKNIITQLAGMNYAIPLNFSTETVPGFPGVHKAKLTLVDFDIFQQKREQLSQTQQAELIEAFGKRNPILRIKQLWGHTSAYPDFPLSVRDEAGNIVGHLDPDYYFRSFKTIDDDVVNRRKPNKRREDDGESRSDDLEIMAAPAASLQEVEEDSVNINFGKVDGEAQILMVHDEGVFFKDGKEKAGFMHVADVDATVSGKTETDNLTPSANYNEQYMGGTLDPRQQFEAMAKDMQYRDKSGRMVRAFPTYMLWLIDEGGNSLGYKVFDNFYGLQSILDLSIIRSEDIMADTLEIKLSNLYSKLSTEFAGKLEENSPAAVMINKDLNEDLNLETRFGEYLVNLETMKLKPGVRVHLRMGYSADPNRMETVFNGQVTEVRTGDILSVIAQSDGVELGALVNSSNEEGHSGKIDGAMMGFYMSEPRDLMITLLTQGSSVVKEVVAHATRGEIFSENRHGIKHFGSMLYTPLSEDEKDKEDRQKQTIKSRIAENGAQDGIFSGLASYLDAVLIGGVHDYWTNLAAKRDYEIFKRNIYPGNGTGVAQYLGGDLGDIALVEAAGHGNSSVVTSTGLDQNGEISNFNPTTGESSQTDVNKALDASGTALDVEAASSGRKNKPPNASYDGLVKTGAFEGDDGNTFLSGLRNLDGTLGLVNRTDDDEKGKFDEVSFRAQTYMKTVWDLFRVCAALLPDYIVAVRPFEERSTVFYGKPHWLYTSGLIPLSTGVTPKNGPPIMGPDQERQEIYEALEKQYAISKDDRLDRISAAAQLGSAFENKPGSQDPYNTTEGLRWNGSPDSILSMPSAHPNLQLPYEQGGVGIEMHIPVSDDLQEDIDKHKQLDSLPDRYRHPFYMDRLNGSRGGYQGAGGSRTYDPNDPNPQAVLKADDPNQPGHGGAFWYDLDPTEEQFYMCQYWPDSGAGNSSWRGRRILVYCEKTKKAVVCTPGDTGPARWVTENQNVMAGVSPDVYFLLGEPTRGVDTCYFKIVSDDTPLGPVKFGTSGSSNTSTRVPTFNDRGHGPESSSNTTSGIIPEWAKDAPKGNLGEYAYKYGHKIEGIPVNYTESYDTTRTGGGQSESSSAFKYFDEIGQQADQVIAEHPDSNRVEQADDIWDQFRTRFAQYAHQTYVESTQFANLSDDERADLLDEIGAEREEAYNRYIQSVQEFQKILWRNAHYRGWVVFRFSPELNVGQSELPFVDVRWAQSSMFGAFAAYLDRGEQGLRTHVETQNDPGRSTSNFIDRAQEVVGDSIGGALDTIGRVIQSTLSVAGGLLDALRASISRLTMGIGMASHMQQRANILNRAYNDSIYYSTGIGPDGSIDNQLLFLADNPFTREYGEPVVEIREPFQRMHMVSSFRHIIDNNIYETQDNVATVITATSNGGDPVTVHFDKGMSPERQVEKGVETGLFYDDPGFWGHLNPGNFVQIERSRQLKAAGQGPELSAKRVALWHLKENLKDIYQGHVTILGDASIRPYDLVYLGDVYERMYGFVEVEEVVHHLSPDTGFVTTIKPNACVTINDPARFYLLANYQGKLSVSNLRDNVRERLSIRADNSDGRSNQDIDLSREARVEEFAQDIEDTLLGTSQFYGGNSAIIKSMTKMSAPMAAAARLGSAPMPSPVPLPTPMGLLGWKMWKWVRDNLLDQHGCYISYLNHNGSPMDAGLSYAQGVAVGHQHSRSLIFKGIKFGELNTLHKGERKIRVQDVVKALQWEEYNDPNSLAQEVDMFVSGAVAEITSVTGRDGALTANDNGIEVYWIDIYNVVDADTFDFNILGRLQNGQFTTSGNYIIGKDKNRLRLAGAQAYEDPYKEIKSAQQRQGLQHVPGVRATDYARTNMDGRKAVLRVDKSRRKDDFGRVLGYVFHNTPDSIGENEQDIRDYLLESAGTIPVAQWDSFTEDGKPRTFDWELITTGHAHTIESPVTFSYPEAVQGDPYGDESNNGPIR